MAAGDVKTDSCDRQPPIPRCTRHASRLWETPHPLRNILWLMGAGHKWEPHPWGERERSRMHRVCTMLSPLTRQRERPKGVVVRGVGVRAPLSQGR